MSLFTCNVSGLFLKNEYDAVDEAQFFDEGLVDVCNKLADNGIRVIVAGLDMDFRRVPFGPIPVSYTHLDIILKPIPMV